MGDAPTIQQALAAVMADVQAVGPVLRKHSVVVLPLVETLDQRTVEVGKNRTLMGHATVTVRYRFVGPDGSWLDAVTPGEAMDSGDKAVSKAMSVAFRTALIQALALPTDEPDPDATSYERSDAPPDVRTVARAKNALMRLVGGDKDRAAAIWAHGPCADAPAEAEVSDMDWAEIEAAAAEGAGT